MIELSNLLLDEFKKEKIVLFGASSRGKRVLNNLVHRGIEKKQIIFCDNDEKKHDKMINDVRIINLNELKERESDIPIIISSSMFEEIKLQLDELGFSRVYYFHDLLFSEQKFEKYDSDFLRLVELVKSRCYMDNDEKYTLYSSMKAVSNIAGDISEVGVYRGGSAKILADIKKGKKIHLFDTFEGLPETTVNDSVKKGWLADTSLESVKEYLEEYDNVFFHKGYFPETAEELLTEKFCLVHLDTDLYQSTLDSLKFFWPRMSKGGRIISHDYNAIEIGGVRQAFQEFFSSTPEKLIEIADTQVMVIK